jgi:hypothetical protein
MFNSYRFEKWQLSNKRQKDNARHYETIDYLHKKRNQAMAFKFKKTILTFLNKVGI